MRHMARPLILVLFICLLASCQKKEEVPRSAAPAPATKAKAELADTGDAARVRETGKGVVDKRKIIKEGELVFETSDLAGTKALIARAVSDVKGYVAEETQDKYADRIEIRVVLRVPADRFDGLMESLATSAATVDRKNVKALDVTEEYIDEEARLRTRKDVERRYRELLARATKVADVVQIEKQLGEVREEIESAEGRLKYFNDRIALSTLTVVFYEKATSPIGFLSKVGHGLAAGWQNFALFIVFLVNIWPFIVLAAAGFYLFRRYRGRRKA